MALELPMVNIKSNIKEYEYYTINQFANSESTFPSGINGFPELIFLLGTWFSLRIHWVIMWVS